MYLHSNYRKVYISKPDAICAYRMFSDNASLDKIADRIYKGYSSCRVAIEIGRKMANGSSYEDAVNAS